MDLQIPLQMLAETTGFLVSQNVEGPSDINQSILGEMGTYQNVTSCNWDSNSHY